MTRASLVLAAVLAAGVAIARPASADATSLVEKADHALRGSTTAAVLRMDVHTASYDRSYSIVYWEDTRRAGGSVLVKILGPARWRGFGTLKTKGQLSFYDPGTDRVTVLSGSMLGASWMGSHFDNDDFVKETNIAKDYAARETRAWTEQAGGRAVTYHDLDLRPKPRAPVAWDHVELRLYEDGAWVVPVRFQYFRRAGDAAPYRTLTFSDPKTIGGRWAPTVLTMTVADKPGEYTRITYESARFDVAVPERKLTEQALRQ